MNSQQKNIKEEQLFVHGEQKSSAMTFLFTWLLYFGVLAVVILYVCNQKGLIHLY